MSIPEKVCKAILVIVLGSGLALVAQTTVASNSSDADYPEKAFLSESRYINQYFDFEFDLPSDIHLEPIPRPAARDGSLQLLELAGPPPADPEIAISVIPIAPGKTQNAKVYLRNALDQELFRGVEELRGLTKATFGGHQFILFETRRGIEQHVVLATTLGDYILQVVATAHDEKIVKRLESAVEHLSFLAAPEMRQYLDAKAKPYDGPSVSSHRLAEMEADPPASHIDPGKFNGDFYENSMLGLSYRIPRGWTIEAEGAVQPAIERDRAKEDFGRPRVGRSERRLLDACSRTLFSAWAKRPTAEGQVSYDEFGEVTVVAISMACFPQMRFPEKATNQQSFKDFLLQFGFTHPIVSDMRDGKVFTAGNNVFLFLHGAVGFQIPDDELSRRLSVAMAITQRRGYLLTWFFAAPHDSELQALTDERVRFDSGPPIKEQKLSNPGGGEAGESSAGSKEGSAAAPRPASPSAPSAESPTPSAAVSPADAASAAGSDQSGQTASQPNSSAPTLLRPGESMQSQQGKGVSVPNNKKK